jgi:hypothetical protein
MWHDNETVFTLYTHGDEMTRRQTIIFVICCWMFILYIPFVAKRCHSSAHAQASSPTLVGTWYLQSFDNKSFNSGAIVVLTLRSDGEYALTTFITLINGNMGLESELGTFRREGRTVRFVPASSTCVTHNRSPRVANYTLTVTTLVLQGTHKNHVFRRKIVFDEADIVRRLNTSLVPPIQGCYEFEHKRFTFVE